MEEHFSHVFVKIIASIHILERSLTKLDALSFVCQQLESKEDLREMVDECPACLVSIMNTFIH